MSRKKTPLDELTQAWCACIQPYPADLCAAVTGDRVIGLSLIGQPGFQPSAFPLVQAELSQNGPELSRRAGGRGAADLDSEDRSEKMKQEGKQRSGMALCETRTSETDAVLVGNHSSISDSWPIALLGRPRGHRVNTETWC